MSRLLHLPTACAVLGFGLFVIPAPAAAQFGQAGFGKGDQLAPKAAAPLTLTTARPAEVLDVWPGKAPSETGSIPEEAHSLGKSGESERIENVSRPTLAVYRPAPDRNNGAALLIAPGGGYRMLAWNKEGVEIAQWANSLGMTGVVLKYRVPRRSDQPASGAPLQPLQDAQRALSIIRSRASNWAIDPHKIGMIGFSAGGSLTANLSTHFQKRAYPAVDATDETSCRPDFAVLVYPGGIVDKQTGKLAPQFTVTKQSPPMFFAVAGDDLSAADNSIQFYQAARAAGLPAELHVYSRGGHGFGLRAPAGSGVANWPQACEVWLRNIAMLPQPPVAAQSQ
ncbi:MAG TPA: alpha/beta hydrolase [Pirellulales bacterium]